MSMSFMPSRGTVSVSLSTTRYLALSSLARAATAEASAEVPVREAGTLSNLFVYVSANTITSNTVITLRKSTVDTSVTVTYTSGQTGIKEDTSNSASYANTDYATLAVVGGGTGTSITLQAWAAEFNPTNTAKCLTILATCGSTAYSTNSATNYIPVAGSQFAPTGTENNVKLKIHSAGTASNLFVYAPTNARTTDTTIASRINGANGNQTVTYTSGQTGRKEDTSNSDTIASGDDINAKIVTSTGGSAFTYEVVSMSVITTTGEFLMQAHGSGNTVNFGTTTHWGAGGGMTSTGVEAQAQTRPRTSFTCQELAAYVSSNSLDNNLVITARDNGVYSALTVTYTTAQTGWKTDLSNSFVLTAATDTVNYTSVSTAAASGSATLWGIGMMGYTAVSSLSFSRGFVCG